MNEQSIQRIMDGLDPRLIEEAARDGCRKRPVALRRALLAACLCLLLTTSALGLVLVRMRVSEIRMEETCTEYLVSGPLERRYSLAELGPGVREALAGSDAICSTLPFFSLEDAADFLGAPLLKCRRYLGEKAAFQEESWVSTAPILMSLWRNGEGLLRLITVEQMHFQSVKLESGLLSASYCERTHLFTEYYSGERLEMGRIVDGQPGLAPSTYTAADGTEISIVTHDSMIYCQEAVSMDENGISKFDLTHPGNEHTVVYNAFFQRDGAVEEFQMTVYSGSTADEAEIRAYFLELLNCFQTVEPNRDGEGG